MTDIRYPGAGRRPAVSARVAAARLGAVALAAACAAGCGRRGADMAPVVPFDPSRVGAVVFLGLDLPAPGSVVGGHYKGAQFGTQQWTYRLTAATRAAWGQAVRGRGEALLRGVGFRVQPIGPAADLTRLRGVQYGLLGRVSAIQVRTTGDVEPYRADAAVEIEWELLDVGSGAVVFGRMTRGSGRAVGTADSAALAAVDEAFVHLLAADELHAALRVVRAPPDALGSSRYVRPVPDPDEVIIITPSDLNISTASGGAVGRIADATVMLRGPGDAFYGTAILLTRDGLALTTTRSARNLRPSRRPLAVFPSGVARPVRTLRQHRGTGVALIQVACPDDCITADWEAVPSLPAMAPVIVVGSGGRTGTVSVSHGNVGGQWGLARGFTIQGVQAMEGQAIARVSNGKVFALVTDASDRIVGVSLAEILRGLKVRAPAATASASAAAAAPAGAAAGAGRSRA